MNYFVTINGVTVASNLNRAEAIELGKKEYENGNSRVSIGVFKYKRGERMYNLMPLYFYTIYQPTIKDHFIPLFD